MTPEELEQHRQYLKGGDAVTFPGLARVGSALLAEVDALKAAHLLADKRADDAEDTADALGTERDALREQVRTLTDALKGYHLDHRCGACGGLLEIHHDAICDKCEASNRHASETDALRAQVRTLTGQLATSEERGRMILCAKNAMCDSLRTQLRTLTAERDETRGLYQQEVLWRRAAEERATNAETESDALRATAAEMEGTLATETVERIRCRDGWSTARDAALEEAAKVCDAEDEDGPYEIRAAARAATSIRALKAQTARRTEFCSECLGPVVGASIHPHCAAEKVKP